MYNFARDDVTQQAVPTSLHTVQSFVSANPSPQFSFYDRFSRQRNKPLMLSETGSAWDSNQKGQRRVVLDDPNASKNELLSKISWVKSIIDAISKLPNFKAAVWFEEIKEESSYGLSNVRVMRDYRMTFSQSIRKEFFEALSDNKATNYIWADSLDRNKTYLCSGVVKF